MSTETRLPSAHPGLIVTASGALVSMNANGDFVYDPNGQFDSLNDGETVVDTFSYEVSDGNGGSATAEVSVTVAGITDAQPVVVTIGNAPSRVSRRDPDAWEDAWTDDLVEISHKQDVTDGIGKITLTYRLQARVLAALPAVIYSEATWVSADRHCRRV